MGLRLPPPTRLCLLRTCATPTWLRSPPRFRPLPDGPPLAFSPNYRTLSNYLLFCISLRLQLTLLLIVGPPLALPMVVGQPRSLTLFLRPRLARTLLRWPLLALLLLRIHPLALGFLLQLRSLVRCGSLRGPQPVALRNLNFGGPTCCHSFSCFPRVFVYRRRDVCSMPRYHGVRVYVLHGEGCGLLLSVTTVALYVSFDYLFYACPSLKCPVGLCYMDTGSDECLGFRRNSSSHFPGLCRLVLTCRHDSLFLRYPAIDIVWRGPVFLAFGFLRHLALHGSAWWSPGLGWCSRQSFSRTSVLPFLALTHALTVYAPPPVVSALASIPNGEFVTVLCLRFHHSHCLRFRRPVVSNDEDLGVWRVPSLPSLTGTSVSAIQPCNLWLGRCIPVSGSTGQWYPWVMYGAVCGCSSHPAVTLRVYGSRCMWPIRSSQGVPATG